MKLTVHQSKNRGHADHGWLKTWHSFSFAGYYNPRRMNFGALRVLNDDVIGPGMGFGTHPHDNMEIVTIILKGELEHRDSMGNGSVIGEGEVQVMSAGTGIQHSEFNHSGEHEVSLLQIWVFPDQKGYQPRYGQAKFSEEEMNGKWRTVVSPDGNGGSLWVHQQTWFSLGLFQAGTTIGYELNNPDNGVYLFLISGEIEVGGEWLGQRDALCIEDAKNGFEVKVNKESKVLAIEVPV